MSKAPAKTPAAARSGRPTARGHQRPALPRQVGIRQRGLAATIGTVAKQARRRVGLTQDPEVYGRMERGELMPSVPTLMRVCLTLGCEPDELMGLSPMKPPQNSSGARMLPHGVNDMPAKRRLLRHLARLDSSQVKAFSRLISGLAPTRKGARE